jgi:UDP:flavonoid glycosyltransferase YjiC (YdhE family)
MRIALATVGTSGDVRPFALLARELVARGHDVTAITWPVHRAALNVPGVRVETAGPHADAARIASVAADAAEKGPMDQVGVLRDFHLADGEAHERRLRELLPGHDLVLLHSIHGLAHAAALDLGLRWATVVFDPVLLPTNTAPPPGMPSLGPANRLLWGMLDRMLRRANGPFDAVLARAGSTQRGLPLFRARSPLLHLVGASPAIMHVPADLPATTRVTGAWADRSEHEPLPDLLQAWLDDGPPPVTVTFGSMGGPRTDALEGAIGAVLDAGRRVVLQGASRLRSPNLATIAAPVDHRPLFARSTLVVHHGGSGTTHTVAIAGIPQVVVPHVGDQRYWADRLHRLGVAPKPIEARELDAGRLADAILATAADPDRDGAATELASRVRGDDGVRAAADALEAVSQPEQTGRGRPGGRSGA